MSKPEPVESLELFASRAQVQGHDFFLLRRVAFSIVDGTPSRDNFCKQPQHNEALLRSSVFLVFSGPLYSLTQKKRKTKHSSLRLQIQEVFLDKQRVSVNCKSLILKPLKILQSAVSDT